MNTEQVEEKSNNIHFDETTIFCARYCCLHKRFAFALTSCQDFQTLNFGRSGAHRTRIVVTPKVLRFLDTFLL